MSTNKPSDSSDAKRRAIGWACLASSILLQSGASAFSKQAGTSGAHGDSLLDLVLNPWYPLTILCMGAQAVAWMLVLRTFKLSFAYPISALIFILHLMWASTVFGEEVGISHVLGIVLIIGGVALVGRETGLDEERQA